MSFTVLLLEDAEKDIEAIYRYIQKSGNKKAARDMIITIRNACDSLSENPERGHTPNELSQVGLFDYRQIIVKKYRIIYQVAVPNIFIFGIIHGNRNIGEVLRQRMLLWIFVDLWLNPTVYGILGYVTLVRRV